MIKYLFILFLIASACSTSQEKQMVKPPSDTTRLHDIWALKKVKGKNLPKDLAKQPVLEIYVQEKKYLGNDGCNSISGKIEILTSSEIVFKTGLATIIACPKGEFSSNINALLLSVRYYSIENLNLILLDKNKQEVLRFLKVD